MPHEYEAVKNDFIMALRIIYREGLSDAFAHLSARSDGGDEMLFMPRKSPALVEEEELFFVDFDKAVPQSSLHQAIYKTRPDVKAIFHFILVSFFDVLFVHSESPHQRR